MKSPPKEHIEYLAAALSGRMARHPNCVITPTMFAQAGDGADNVAYDCVKHALWALYFAIEENELPPIPPRRRSRKAD